MKGYGKDKKSGPALLIGIGPKPKGEGEMDEESDDDVKEAKMAAATAIKSAIKADDDEALVEALDAFLSC